MNNLFGIGILFEVRDKMSNALRGVSRALDNTETQANQTVNAVNRLQSCLSNTSGFTLSTREAQTLDNMLNGTSRQAESLQRRMQYMAHYMGGEMSESTKTAYATMFALREEIRQTQRQFGKYSVETMEARNRLTEFALALNDTTFKQVYMRSQLGLTSHQLQQQANSILLNARMTKLMTNQLALMDERMRGLQKHGIKPEHLLPPSTPGIFENVNTVMSYGISPLNKLSEGHRKLGASVEKTIKSFSAQKQAIKLANGDMVKYNRLLMNIQQTSGNLAIALPLVGMGAIQFYKTLFTVAYDTNESFQKLVETVKGKVLKAFQPLIQVALDVGTAFLKMVGKVADMISAFNEAHPVLARILGVIGFLVPALTTLSLTVVAGVGVWRMWMIALSSVWPLISGVVAMILTASSTALALASAFAVVTVTLTHLWKTNEKFRNAIIGIWENIKEFVTNAIDSICRGVTTLIDAYKEGGLPQVLQVMKEAFINTFNSIQEGIVPTLENLKSFVVKIGGVIQEELPKLIEKGKLIAESIVEGVSKALPKILDTGKEIITTLIDTIVTVTPKVLEIGGEIVMSIAKGISEAIPQLYKLYKEIKTSIVEGIKEVIPKIIPVAIEIITSLVEGFAKGLPLVLEVGSQLFETLIQGISENLPKLLEFGVKAILLWARGFINNLGIVLEIGSTLIQELAKALIDNLPSLIESGVAILETILETIISNVGILLEGAVTILLGLIEAISENLSMLMDVAVQLITTLVNFISENLPVLIPLGLRILTTLVSALLENLPLLLDVGLQVLTTLINAIVENLPMLIAVGVQLIVELFTAIVENLPLLIGAGVQIITVLCQTIIQALPQILALGVQLIVSLVSGIVQAIPQLLATIVTLMLNIITGIAQQLPQILQKGREIIDRLKQGIDQRKENVKTAMKNVLTSIKNTAKEGISAFVSIGGDIIKGLARGISNGISNVVEAVSGVVKKAIKTGKKLLGINSPSKVFKQIGAWTSEGMSIGIDNKAPLVTNSIKDLGNDAVVQARNIVNQDLMLNSDITSPSLPDINLSTPRLDLASLSNNANARTVDTSQQNVTNNFTINLTVNDSNKKPKELVDDIMEELKRRTQLKNTLLYR